MVYLCKIIHSFYINNFFFLVHKVCIVHKVYKVLISPERIFDISSVSLKFLLKLFYEILFNSLARYNIERTSPHEPFAIKRNCLNSLFVFL